MVKHLGEGVKGQIRMFRLGDMFDKKGRVIWIFRNENVMPANFKSGMRGIERKICRYIEHRVFIKIYFLDFH